MADLPNRSQIEGELATQLGRLSNRHRKELLSLLGSPPDPKNVPPAFWEKVQRETEEELVALLLLVFIASAEAHGMQAGEASAYGMQAGEASALGLTAASERARRVAAEYVENSLLMLERAKRTWEQQELTGSPPTKQDAADVSTRIFGPSRAQRMATNETTNMAVDAGEEVIRTTVGFSEDDTWYTENDSRVCPICEPLHAAPRSRWQRFFNNGPPAHVGCRCWIEYAREKEPLAV